MIDNPYVRCLEAAARLTERKRVMRQSERWNNILRYLDFDDVFYPDGRMRPQVVILGKAGHLLRGEWNKTHKLAAWMIISDDLSLSATPGFGRDTERDAFVAMISESLTHYKRGKKKQALTAEQTKVVALDRYAKQQGANVSELIGQVMGITDRNAEKRLAKIQAKSDGYGDKNGIMKLETRLKAIPRTCAYCNNRPVLKNSNALCWECHNRFILRRNYNMVKPELVQNNIDTSNEEHWERIRDVLVEFGVVEKAA